MRKLITITAAAFVSGLLVGAAAAGPPPNLQPCVDTIATAGELLDMSASMLEATTDRATATTWEDRAVHTAEVRHLAASIDATTPAYAATEAACLEVAQ